MATININHTDIPKQRKLETIKALLKLLEIVVDEATTISETQIKFTAETVEEDHPDNGMFKVHKATGRKTLIIDIDLHR